MHRSVSVNYHCQRFAYSNEGKGAISIVPHPCEEVRREGKQGKRERKRGKTVYFRRNVTREFNSNKLDVVNIAREKKESWLLSRGTDF